MNKRTDEELCSTLRENNGLINCQAQIQAANRIEELSTKLDCVKSTLQSLQSLNCFDVVTNNCINTIITFIYNGEYPDVSKSYNFYQPCFNNSEENVTKILKEQHEKQ